MLKRSKKLLSCIMGITLVTSIILTGCNNKTTPTTTEPGGEEKKLEGTINVNLMAAPGAKEGWEALAKAYMDKNPGVKVVVDLKPSEGYEDWVTKQFGSDSTTADIININMAGSSAVGKGINYMEYVNLESPYSGKAWKEQFNLQMQQKDLARNEMTALSLDSVQVLWFYNKQIFQEAGVNPPETWNELIDVCEKIKSAGYQPLALAGDYNSFWAGQLGWLAQIYADQTTRSLIDVYRAQEGDYCYDEDIDGNFKMDLNDPFNDDAWKVNTNTVRVLKAIKDGEFRGDSAGMKTVYENLAKVFPKYSGGDAFFGTRDALPLFYQGKAAIYLDGAWRLSLFKNDMDKMNNGEEILSGETKIEGVKKFDLGTFNMPSMEGEGIEAKARTIEVPIGFVGAIKKDKAHDDLVMDFIMYYSSKEGYSKLMTALLENGAAPAGPPLVHGVQLPAEYQELFKDLEFIGNCQKGYGVFIARGSDPGNVESTREWYAYTSDLLNGKINVDEWAKKNQENVIKNFDKTLINCKVDASDLEHPENAPSVK